MEAGANLRVPIRECVLKQINILCGLACLLAQTAGAAVSETDYLADVPNVLSVSRLSQTLEDTPGAVTVLDRGFIRATGARSVVDVLRFVPGFQTTSSFDTDAPMATYHGRNDDWANRIQVLVDGRSVYSGLLQGSAGIGWQTLALDDIERIEVLRGSNSASYGSRAFLGVVNIISRDVRETLGAAVSLVHGEKQIADVGARVGWSAQDASFRLSADSVSDDGLQAAFGQNHTERLNFSSHFALERGAELDLRAGGVGIYSGRGSFDPAQYGNPLRRWTLGSQFLQADWRKPLDDSQDLSIIASHTENSSVDRFPYQEPGTYFGANVDFSGNEYVDALTLQHTLRISPTLRTVWGAEFRREKIVSLPLLDTLGSVSTDFYRLFGSAEWHLTDTLLLNAGALAEHTNADGDSVSPRLMLNWRVAPGHTLRIGASTAFRPPSAYEKYGQVQYRDVNGQNPTGYYTYNDGSLRPEKLFSQELGYYFAPPGGSFSGDIRLFDEQIRDGIAHTDTPIVPGVHPQNNVNQNQNQITGAELQLNWSPSPATRIMLAQNWTAIHVSEASSLDALYRTTRGAPRYAASLSLMQRFNSGWHVALMHQVSDDVALMSSYDKTWLFSMQRTDLRLAKDLVLGRSKAELGFVLQNMGEPYQDGDLKYTFQRRGMLTLKIEY
jgi:iron complex outermembrane receptor protein